MNAYFEYLKEMIIAVFSDIWNFIVAAFASPWSTVGNNFGYYNDVFHSYYQDFGVVGWIFFVIFAIFFIALIGAAIFGLYLLIRKYVRFVKRELDKDALREQVERLNFELYNAMQEREKILNLKVGYMGFKTDGPSSVTSPEQTETKEAIEEITSRFPKLAHVDNIYKGRNTEIAPVDGLSLEELCNKFRNFACSQLHLYYKIETIRQLFAGMATSKLMILEGISGTGKTSITYALGKFFNFDAVICPVQPSWKDRAELLGYYNEFTKKFNESEFLRALYTSLYRRDVNVIVLDEMNLARIEYYFAEFLSLMEMPNVNDWKVELVASQLEGDPKLFQDGKILIPQNAYFFGTANNDDSTFTISDKVYDRACSLFFDDKGIAFECEPEDSILMPYSQMERLFNEAKANFPVSESTLKKFDELDSFVIKKFKLAFGNRILKQMKSFIPVYVGCGGTELDGLDFIFTNKILKKFESLNIAFLRDELGQLDQQLSKLFGKNTFPLAHAFIDNLNRMN